MKQDSNIKSLRDLELILKPHPNKRNSDFINSPQQASHLVLKPFIQEDYYYKETKQQKVKV